MKVDGPKKEIERPWDKLDDSKKQKWKFSESKLSWSRSRDFHFSHFGPSTFRLTRLSKNRTF